MKVFKNNHFVKFSVILFLFIFYFLNKMFMQTSNVEGFYRSCPQNQYLNKQFNKCCAMEKWYSPSRNTCLAQQQGSCPLGQYINDKYSKCCDKDKYYHNGSKTCVNMK
jgi:hypothetical protein